MMRFTDNPLEDLMRQKPEGGWKDEPVLYKPPPICLKCPYRSFICNYGICWNPHRERENHQGERQGETQTK